MSGLLDTLKSIFNSEEETEEELKAERESLRLKAVRDGDPIARKRILQIDNILIDIMNERYSREHPDGKTRQTEHGWYLPEDDD